MVLPHGCLPVLLHLPGPTSEWLCVCWEMNICFLSAPTLCLPPARKGLPQEAFPGTQAVGTSLSVPQAPGSWAAPHQARQLAAAWAHALQGEHCTPRTVSGSPQPYHGWRPGAQQEAMLGVPSLKTHQSLEKSPGSRPTEIDPYPFLLLRNSCLTLHVCQMGIITASTQQIGLRRQVLA